MKIITQPDDSVLLDAARMLGIASRIVKRVAKAPSLTEEYRTKLLNEAKYNITAALARI